MADIAPRSDEGGGLLIAHSGRRALQWLGALGAFVILLVIGFIAEPRSLGVTALLSMLPFMAILAVASTGQYLVIRQPRSTTACGVGADWDKPAGLHVS